MSCQGGCCARQFFGGWLDIGLGGAGRWLCCRNDDLIATVKESVTDGRRVDCLLSSSRHKNLRVMKNITRDVDKTIYFPPYDWFLRIRTIVKILNLEFSSIYEEDDKDCLSSSLKKKSKIRVH